MRAQRVALAVLIALAARAATAHGPQIQITDDNNKLVTRQLFRNEPYTTLSPPVSVYVIAMKQFGGIWYAQPNSDLDPILQQPAFPSGPGLAYGFDQIDGGTRDFAAGTTFSENFTDGLKLWNGSSFVDPGSEQIGAFRGSAVAPPDQALTADSAPFAGITYPPISATYTADDHSSARFRLLGNGTDPLSPSQDGVYLLSLQLASTQPGLAPSDAFYFVLCKNATAAATIDAVNALVQSRGISPSLVQFVPEPASLLHLALGTAICLGLVPLGRRFSCQHT